MTVPRNFTQWFDREIEGRAEKARRIAADLREELGHLVRELEALGPHSTPWSPNVVGRAVELKAELEALRTLKELREHKWAFESLEADADAALRQGSAACAQAAATTGAPVVAAAGVRGKKPGRRKP